MASKRQHSARERLVMRKTPFGKRQERYDMILGFFPGKIPGLQNSKGKVLTVASYRRHSDVSYENNWHGSDGTAATRTSRGAGSDCGVEAKAGARVNDGPREWSEAAAGRFPHLREARR